KLAFAFAHFGRALNKRVGDVKRHRQQAALITKEQVAGLNGEPTDGDGHTEIKKGDIAMRDHPAGGKDLKAGGAATDTTGIAAAAVGDDADDAEFLETCADHIAHKTAFEAVGPHVLVNENGWFGGGMNHI